MLPFGVNIPATALQSSEIPDGLMNYPVERLYVKRKGGGRGLLQTEVAYKEQIINIAEYLNTKYAEDQFLNIIKKP
jgi:hypothetical protein